MAVAFAWFYHGLVPKLLGPARDELLMNEALGLSTVGAPRLADAAGMGEMAFAGVVLLARHHEWPLWLTLGAMAVLLAYAAWSVPPLLAGA
ncbi:DoxX-like family protein, partial [Acinetobacter baumannii]